MTNHGRDARTSPGAMNMRLARARKRLAELLEEMGQVHRRSPVGGGGEDTVKMLYSIYHCARRRGE